MASVNFGDGADEKPVIKRVKAGAQVLTITSIEEDNSANGTPFMNVTFHSEKHDADFKHKFYLTEKSVNRLKSLVVGFTGQKLTGNVDTAVLIPMLIGQSSNCIVDIDLMDKESNGKVYKNEYATLRYADFANKTTPYQDSDARITDKSAPQSVVDSANALAAVVPQTDDLPF